MFPCMGRDWRILATSPQQQRFLAEVTQESVPSRIQTVPASSMQDSQRKVMSWAKETGKWKAPNERMGKPQMRGRESPNWRKEDAFSLRRGKQIAEQKRKKSSWKMLKSECPNEGKEKPKLGEGRKAAAQPHPVDLCQVRQWKGASSRVDDTNYVHYSPLSMKIFATICHGRKIPWL